MRTLILGLLVLMCSAAETLAQGSEGSIRGYIRDEQGGLLPGVTVTATSPTVASAYTAVTDQEGHYRLLNLPPGTYTVAATLQGFAKIARADMVMRAGLNLSVDIVMKVGGLQETITVSGETPLLEASNPGQAVNVSGEMAQSIPLAGRRHWSEFLRFTPGAVVGDGTQNTAGTFYVHGAGFNSYVTTVDGSDMSSGQNPWPGYSDLPSGTIADVQIATSGLDAATPLGFGVASNVVTKSGTDHLRGTGTFAVTPKAWTGTNTPGGTSEFMTLVQPEIAAGGPIQRQRWWLFGSYRYRSGSFGIGRPADQVADMKLIDPSFVPFDKDISGPIPFVKVTGQINRSHRVESFVNQDKTTYDFPSSLDTAKFRREFIGGWGYSGRLASVWTNWLTSNVGFSWNNKSFGRWVFRNDLPSRRVYRDVQASSGRLSGVSQRATLDNADTTISSPYYKWTVTTDFNAYKSGWLGTHDFRFGAWLQPTMHLENTTNYVNGGFTVQDEVLRDPTNAAGGTVPFRRQIFDADHITSSRGNFADYAVYIQDSWRPMPRATVTLGLRVDWVTRRDDIFKITTQDSVDVGPRLGINYMLTSDQRNAVRASFMRAHDAPSINQTLFTAGTNTLGFRELYDLDRNGDFETVFPTPASTALNPSRIFDPDYHQPFVDEWTVGYRRQLPGQATLDVGFIHRDYRDRPALVEQNAIYEGSVFKGYRNENQNDIFLLTTNRWNSPIYKALEILASKQTDRFQLLGSFTRSFNHMSGTWQPNDPASFIQPAAFPINRGLEGNDNRGASSNNGLNAGTGGAEWTEQIVRFSAVYHAPWKFNVATNYALQGGRWSGPILTRVAVADPQFGTATVRLSNGRVVSNPLATLNRFAFETRGDGQFKLPALHVVNLRIGREFRLVRNRRLQLDLDFFNVGNLGRFQGFLGGANQLFNVNYGRGGSVQQPVSAQLGVRYSF
ncbi:MAG TPA: TonB-dependent receptor [Vicinamibacterales bacterium]|nr:TonB-dependent receptor [Vicinamibacterales bacterium]